MRLEEVAHVYDGVENDKSASWQAGERCVMLSIRKQPGTNVVEVVDRIKALLPTFREQLPPSVTLDIRSDRSLSIRDSVHDVKVTLLITIALVVLVIFLFLRNISATLIPSLALPGSLVGTFMVMYLLGYSLDNLSLMALTLSVGFVVDDAIVMLENIVRHMEMGKPPMQAALDGSKEIAFTILSMTISLAAVFIPVLFMGGIVGRLLHEFSVTIGVAILVSGFVSISLTPMLCSRFLKPIHGQRHGWVYNAFERMFDAWLRLYDWHAAADAAVPRGHDAGVARADRRHGLPVHGDPEGLPAERGSGPVPGQHRGGAGHQLRRHGAPPAGGRRHHRRRIRTSPASNVNVGPIGNNSGSLNTGRIWVELKPRDERKLSVDEKIAALRPKIAQIPGIRAFMTNQPPINLGGGGGGSRALYQFTLQDTDTAELYKWAPIVEEKIRQLARARGRQQRPAAQEPAGHRRHGPQQGVDARSDRHPGGDGAVQRLRHAAGVADLRAEQPVPGDPAGRAGIPERSRRRCRCCTCGRTPGRLIPLESVARMKTRRRAVVGRRTSGSCPAVTISFNLKPNFALGDAVDGIQAIAATTLPATIATSFQGAAQAFQDSLQGLGSDSRRGDHRHLHRARRAVRELHAPADDSVGPAVGRLRRAADAADLQDRAEPVRVRRHHHAGRPGEEERHHDGGLRGRRAARARQVADSRPSTRPASCASARS